MRCAERGEERSADWRIDRELRTVQIRQFKKRYRRSLHSQTIRLNVGEVTKIYGRIRLLLSCMQPSEQNNMKKKGGV